MTIIYSNYLDDDCKTLQELWRGFTDAKVIEVIPSSNDWDEKVDNAISEETDTLIMCGHGSSNGLLFPNLYKGEYIIHENNINLIKANRVICVWCYASGFCLKFPNFNSFSTSMFISNEQEATENGINGYNQEIINNTAENFYKEINYLLRKNTPLSEWVALLKNNTDTTNAVDVFNRQCLNYQ